jgi:hypothetical protein
VAAVALGILLFAALASFLFYFVVQMSNPSIPPIPYAQKARVDYEPQVIEAEAVKRIEITCARATVTVKRGKSTQPLETIRIEESHRDDGNEHIPTAWSISNGTLYLDIRDSVSAWLDTKHTVVTISPDLLDRLVTLSIDASAGEISLYDLTSDALEITAKASSIQIDGFTTPTAKLTLSSTVAKLDGTFGVVDGTVTSSDVEMVACGEPKRIRFKTGSSDVTIALPEGLGFTAHTSIGTGNVTFDQRVESPEQGTAIYGDGTLDLDVSVSSGSVHITQH